MAKDSPTQRSGVGRQLRRRTVFDQLWLRTSRVTLARAPPGWSSSVTWLRSCRRRCCGSATLR